MTQIATTIEQSKDLLRLGLSLDTADMYYPKVDEDLYATCPYPKECATFRKQKSDIPAWSLSALLGLMPRFNDGSEEKYTDIRNRASYFCIDFIHVYDGIQHKKHKAYSEISLIDAAYNMVAWLLENGHIKTEKK